VKRVAKWIWCLLFHPKIVVQEGKVGYKGREYMSYCGVCSMPWGRKW